MLVAVCLASLAQGQLLGVTSCLLICAFAISHHTSIHIKFKILVEQLRSRRKFRELAERDMLTGLSNRRSFEASLHSAVLQRSPIAVLFIDLDGFKGVNDTFGHSVGDALLQQVATRLREAVRGSDLVARLGGDEFAILHAAVATETTANLLAERISFAIALPFTVNGELIHIGASVGIRISDVRDVSFDRLLKDADEALYRVKRAGGRAFAFAAPAR
jgi:diguanylate cyclase (GGDEF)-like protein